MARSKRQIESVIKNALSAIATIDPEGTYTAKNTIFSLFSRTDNNHTVQVLHQLLLYLNSQCSYEEMKFTMSLFDKYRVTLVGENLNDLFDEINACSIKRSPEELKSILCEQLATRTKPLNKAYYEPKSSKDRDTVAMLLAALNYIRLDKFYLDELWYTKTHNPNYEKKLSPTEYTDALIDEVIEVVGIKESKYDYTL